jgi:hypothetical protein
MQSLKDLCCIKIVVACKTRENLKLLPLPVLLKKHLQKNAAIYFDSYCKIYKDDDFMHKIIIRYYSFYSPHLHVCERNIPWNPILITFLRNFPEVLNGWVIREKKILFKYYSLDNKRYCQDCWIKHGNSNWFYNIEYIPVEIITSLSTFCSNCYHMSLAGTNYFCMQYWKKGKKKQALKQYNKDTTSMLLDYVCFKLCHSYIGLKVLDY